MVICVKVLTEDCKFHFHHLPKLRLKSLTKNSYFLENSSLPKYAYASFYRARNLLSNGMWRRRMLTAIREKRSDSKISKISRVFPEDLINSLNFYVFISSILLNFRDNSRKINKMLNKVFSCQKEKKK